MAKKKLDIEAYIMTITPGDAAEMLAKSVNYRGRMVERRAGSYARSMAGKRWRVGAPLMFGPAGNLLDGFHRLRAVEIYGQPIEFMVLENVPSAIVETLDNGMARTAAAVLTGFCGVTANATQVGRVLKGMVEMPYRSIELTYLNADMPILLQLYRPAMEFALPVVLRKITAAGVLAVVFGRAWQAIAEGKFTSDGLASVAVLHGRLAAIRDRYMGLLFEGADDPMRLLYKRLDQSRSSKGERLRESGIYFLAAKAISGALMEQTLKQLKAAESDPFKITLP